METPYNDSKTCVCVCVCARLAI